MAEKRHIVVALTGASGSRYGIRLVERLLAAGCRVSLLISAAGQQVLLHETGIDWHGDIDLLTQRARTHFSAGDELLCYANDDFFAAVASGSSAPAAMVIVPCSMGTLGRIASGLSSNLIERTADVALKERRTLLLVPRETPFNRIHLQNMLRLDEAGAEILPAMPAFYQQPESIDDLVDFVVGKILDRLAIDHNLFRRWGAEE